MSQESNLSHNKNQFSKFNCAIETGSSLCIINTKGEVINACLKLCPTLQYKSEELVGKSFCRLIQNSLDFTYILKRVIEQGYNSLKCLGQDLSDSIRLNAEIIETQKELIYILGDIIENHSQETSLHIKRVALISEFLASKYGLDKEHSDMIKVASSVHDIGKISIPDEILNKPGKLTDAEFQIIKKHPEIGFDLLKSSDKPLIKMAAVIAYQHHEHFNGKGYPRGLVGKNISIEARIVGLADVFDALSSQRIYKAPWKRQDIEVYFEADKGQQFDPELVAIFLANMDEIFSIRSKLIDQSK